MTVPSHATNGRRQKTAEVLLALTALIVTSSAAAAIIIGYRVNLTTSEPIGLWRIVALDRQVLPGDLVFICPPDTLATHIARDRGYFRFGLCPSMVAPLIKRVIAVAGQHVEIGASVTVDGRSVAFSRLALRDGSGRTLTPFVGGVVPKDTVFLHSPYRGSYDSRYFGPLPSSGILGLAEQVLTYVP